MTAGSEIYPLALSLIFLSDSQQKHNIKIKPKKKYSFEQHDNEFVIGQILYGVFRANLG